MKKYIFNIFLISILSIFLVTGCTIVGASDLPTNSDNNEKDVQTSPPGEIAHIDDSNSEEGDKIDPDEETDLEIEPDEIGMSPWDAKASNTPVDALLL